MKFMMILMTVIMKMSATRHSFSHPRLKGFSEPLCY